MARARRLIAFAALLAFALVLPAHANPFGDGGSGMQGGVSLVGAHTWTGNQTVNGWVNIFGQDSTSPALQVRSVAGQTTLTLRVEDDTSDEIFSVMGSDGAGPHITITGRTVGKTALSVNCTGVDATSNACADVDGDVGAEFVAVASVKFRNTVDATTFGFLVQGSDNAPTALTGTNARPHAIIYPRCVATDAAGVVCSGLYFSAPSVASGGVDAAFVIGDLNGDGTTRETTVYQSDNNVTNFWLGANISSVTFKHDVSGSDAGTHDFDVNMDGKVPLRVRTTGDGAGGVGGATLSFGVTAAADVIAIGDADADFSWTDPQHAMTSAGAFSTQSITMLGGTIDLSTALALNIGNSATDFTTGGGLTLAGAFVANNNVTLGDGDEISIDANVWDIPTTGAAALVSLSLGNLVVTNMTGGSATIDFGATAGGACDAGGTTITATGAAVGDPCSVGANAALDPDTHLTAAVSGTNTVTVYRCCQKLSGACADGGSSVVFKAICFSF